MTARFQLLALFLFGCGARDDFTGRTADPCKDQNRTYQECVLGDAPLGYWRLDDVVNGIAADASGNGLFGSVISGTTNQQPSLLAGDPNYAMNFNNGGVLLPTTGGLAFAADVSFSIELWIATTNLSTQLPFSQQRCTPDSIQVWMEGGYIGFRVATDSSVDVRAVGSKFIGDGLSHHVVAVRDMATSVLRVFVDGALEVEVDDTNRVVGSLVTYPTDTWIGRRSDCGGENPFFGTIDEVAIYPSALSEQRVVRHYESGTRLSGLAALTR